MESLRRDLVMYEWSGMARPPTYQPCVGRLQCSSPKWKRAALFNVTVTFFAVGRNSGTSATASDRVMSYPTKA